MRKIIVFLLRYYHMSSILRSNDMLMKINAERHSFVIATDCACLRRRAEDDKLYECRARDNQGIRV